jgi:curved DNA-binding protein CbpA
MKRMHPDRQLPEHREAYEELARRLNAAYATLADPLKRQAYDRTIRQQVIQDQIMNRYVGGFQSFDQRPGPAAAPRWREPTEAERRERNAADRQASLTLVLVAVGVTALILVLLLKVLFQLAAQRGALKVRAFNVPAARLAGPAQGPSTPGRMRPESSRYPESLRYFSTYAEFAETGGASASSQPSLSDIDVAAAGSAVEVQTDLSDAESCFVA